jgi:hypothetical protein
MQDSDPGGHAPGETMKERVRRAELRLVTKDEMPRWMELMARHHYLGRPDMVGEVLCYVATVDGEWAALIGWASAAWQVKARDQWIGWSDDQRHRRLRFVANNVRYCILPGWNLPNLASRVLALNTRRLAADWQDRFDHPVILAETFVDPSRFNGTCYQAAGWANVGRTRGFGRHGRQWEEHKQPKMVWVRPLQRPAQYWLSAEFDAPMFSGRTPVIDVNTVPLEGPHGLLAALERVPDPRRRRGIRHRQTTVLAVAVCAVLSGARSFLAIADWAQSLPQDLLKRLGCRRRNDDSIERIPPSEPTIRRTLESIDADALDRVLHDFLQQHGLGRAIAIDGKTLRGSGHGAERPRHLMAAVIHQTGVVVGQMAVDRKTNEITVAQPLLTPLDLVGQVVTADAMHTQHDFARYLVEQKRADYVLTVKDNQPRLKKHLAQLAWDFPPSGGNSPKGPRSH